MSKVRYEGQFYEVQGDESVLQCLHRHGVAIPSSCGSGICQSCLMRSTAGSPPKQAQAGLEQSLKDRSYFLACLCQPESDLEVTLAGDDVLPRIAVRVVDKHPINSQILRLRLECLENFTHKAGQFLNLHRPDGLSRSYSIASSLPDNQLELHIEYLSEGKMSGWIQNELKVGDQVEIDGPHGDCYYTPNHPDQNLLLIGTGSGLAPLMGVLADALAQGHQGKIHLFHGSHDAGKLYRVDQLKRLSDEYPNVFYTPCVSGEDVPQGYYAGRANVAALSEYPDLTGWQLFLCGHPGMVEETKKKAFLAGASLQEILSDPFEYQ